MYFEVISAGQFEHDKFLHNLTINSTRDGYQAWTVSSNY